jgi:amidohydrolase
MKGSADAIGKNKYLDSAYGALETMRSIRRDLHKHPELGMQEERTAQIIADRLKDLGLEVRTGVGGTGVVGLLQGRGQNKSSARTVALRADIDALPMQDQKSVEYASTNPGVAHSCGHDAHTAILLGAAEILRRESDQLSGNVKFIFQPSEDTLPGGAVPMIEDGVLENPRVDAIFSLHLYPHFEEGTVAVKLGNASTSSTSFTLTLRGTGGHVGMPHKVVNPLLMAALIMTNSQSTLPKSLAPGEPLIFEFASIHGGTVGNIVPPEVVLKGGIRVSSPELLEEMISRFDKLIRAVVETAGGNYTLELQSGYPTIMNDIELGKLWQNGAAKVIGEDKVVEHDRIMTGGDDAAYFQQRVPGVYWWLGIRNEEKGFAQPLHSPYFNFNEDVLAIGAAVQAQVVFDYLQAR